MRFGFVLPGGTANEQVALAVAADRAGWDGVFVWEAAHGVDAWTLLAAMSQRTERVKLGTMLTPLPWRRPWKVASQAVTLDHLSGGRAILAVGLGAVDDALGTTGEVTDRRHRAELLDEGLEVITSLWEGRYDYEGQHYQVDLRARADGLTATALPVSHPRVPIWVVGAWPRPKSMRRVLRYDGVLPMGASTPEDLRAMIDWLRARGGDGPGFDVVVEGETPSDDPVDAAATVDPWRAAGATWWLETRWMAGGGNPSAAREEVMARLEAGPPPLSTSP